MLTPALEYNIYINSKWPKLVSIYCQSKTWQHNQIHASHNAEVILCVRSDKILVYRNEYSLQQGHVTPYCIDVIPALLTQLKLGALPKQVLEQLINERRPC